MKPYLDIVTKPQHSFLLTIIRFNYLHFLLAEPLGWRKIEDLGPYSCDKFSSQDTLHFVMFCEHYLHIRKRFIFPILKDKGFLQARPALTYLQMLNNPWEIFNIASFLVAAVRPREKKGPM